MQRLEVTILKFRNYQLPEALVTSSGAFTDPLFRGFPGRDHRVAVE
jgi:hypothetical protein